MAFSNDDLLAASARMSSSQDSVAKGRTGHRDQDIVWLTERSRFARAVVADPDIVFYYLWLCSNQLRVLVMQAEDLLEDMIIGAEGMKFSQPAVGASAVDTLSGAMSTLSTVVTAGAAPDPSTLSRVTSLANKYVSSTLLPTIKTGTRVQVKGAEATSKYATAKKKLFKVWKDITRLCAHCSASSVLNVAAVQAEALKVPVANMQLATTTTFSAESASAHTLQVLAGLSSIQAMSVTIDMTSRPFWSDYATMRTAVQSVVLLQLASLSAQIAVLEGATAAETRDLCQFLAGIAVQFDLLSTDAQASLDRQGAEYTAPSSTLADALLAYNPAFSKATVRAGKAALDTMRSNKFDYAEEMLLLGYVDGVIAIRQAQGASHTGKVSSAASGVAAALPSSRSAQ